MLKILELSINYRITLFIILTVTRQYAIYIVWKVLYVEITVE